MPNCGECLMRDVEIVNLDEDGICPVCGADYSSFEEGAAVLHEEEEDDY